MALDSLLSAIRSLSLPAQEQVLQFLSREIPRVTNDHRPFRLGPIPNDPVVRKTDVDDLRGLLEPAHGVTVLNAPLALPGHGGVGKTTLARQCIRALYEERRLDAVVEVAAATPELLQEQLASLDVPAVLNLYEGREAPTDLNTRVEHVKRWFATTSCRWLLLLDAADADPAREAVRALVSELGAHGTLLVTSRVDAWPESFRRKTLGVYSPPEALDYLCKHGPPATDADRASRQKN